MKKLTLALGLAVIAIAATSVGVQSQGIPLPQIQVTPSTYDFGTVPVGAVAQGNLLVTNTGGGPLIVNNVKTKSPFADGASSFTLQAGQSRRINIAFAPPAPGPYSSYCTIDSNASNNPLVIIPLSGTGQ
jgi:hypothetical protein